LNAIRTRSLIGQADIVVVRFGDKFRQWNAAFDAGFAARFGGGFDLYTSETISFTFASSYVLATGAANKWNTVDLTLGLQYRF